MIIFMNIIYQKNIFDLQAFDQAASTTGAPLHTQPYILHLLEINQIHPHL